MNQARARGNGPGITVADLRHAGLGVFCWCNRCGHNTVLSVDRLGPKTMDETAVPALGRRLRCRNCGAKDASARPAWPTQGVVARHTR